MACSRAARSPLARSFCTLRLSRASFKKVSEWLWNCWLASWPNTPLSRCVASSSARSRSVSSAARFRELARRAPRALRAGRALRAQCRARRPTATPAIARAAHTARSSRGAVTRGPELGESVAHLARAANHDVGAPGMRSLRAAECSRRPPRSSPCARSCRLRCRAARRRRIRSALRARRAPRPRACSGAGSGLRCGSRSPLTTQPRTRREPERCEQRLGECVRLVGHDAPRELMTMMIDIV